MQCLPQIQFAIIVLLKTFRMPTANILKNLFKSRCQVIYMKYLIYNIVYT